MSLKPESPETWGLALQVVQHLHRLGAVYGGVGLKGSFAHTHHNALLVDIGHGVVIPLVLGDVHKGPILGDEGHIHGNAAAGHGEGILAVALAGEQARWSRWAALPVTLPTL